jgi:hypothetical protein
MKRTEVAEDTQKKSKRQKCSSIAEIMEIAVDTNDSTALATILRNRQQDSPDSGNSDNTIQIQAEGQPVEMLEVVTACSYGRVCCLKRLLAYVLASQVNLLTIAACDLNIDALYLLSKKIKLTNEEYGTLIAHLMNTVADREHKKELIEEVRYFLDPATLYYCTKPQKWKIDTFTREKKLSIDDAARYNAPLTLRYFLSDNALGFKEKENVLFLSVINSAMLATKVLIDAAVDVNAQNASGRSLLSYATDPMIAYILLKAGARYDAAEEHTDTNGTIQKIYVIDRLRSEAGKNPRIEGVITMIQNYIRIRALKQSYEFRSHIFKLLMWHTFDDNE